MFWEKFFFNFLFSNRFHFQELGSYSHTYQKLTLKLVLTSMTQCSGKVVKVDTLRNHDQKVTQPWQGCDPPEWCQHGVSTDGGAVNARSAEEEASVSTGGSAVNARSAWEAASVSTGGDTIDA